MARFLHTADLHLGRTLYGERLLADQEAVLAQLTALIDANPPDALLIAGDVFDRSVPPAEAVDVLDQFLYAIAGERSVPVVMIPGNHDSADRLGFGARLLGAGRLHIVSSLQRAATPLVIHDESGPIELFGLPFLEPARVREYLSDDDIRDHQSATSAMVQEICNASTASRKVLVAHAFVRGGTVSDSERALTIGGLDTVDASVFAPFNYVALGHLHRPQTAGLPQVQYSGSPLKYSASELDHAKSFTSIEIDKDGGCTIEHIPIEVQRDLVRVEGTIDELLSGEYKARASDLVIARLMDKGPVHDAMNRLRARWPHTLHIERTHIEATNATPLAGKDHRELAIDDLFTMFFSAVTNESMSESEAAILNRVIEGIRTQEGSS
jgi:exonuclease SbcD